MRRSVWLSIGFGAAVLIGAGRDVTAQADRRATATAPRFDPFANPVTNPYLNPLATRVPADRTTAGLYFLSARRQWRQQAEDARRPRVESPRGPVADVRTRPEHATFGVANPRAFRRGTTIDRGAHFGRVNRYFPY